MTKALCDFQPYSSALRPDRRSLLKAGAAAFAVAVAAPGWARAQETGGTLRVSNGGDPPDFDMHQTATYLTQMLCAPCYSTLMRVDPNDYEALVPDLAESWEVSEDGLAFTVTLREGAVFHDDSPVTSADVAYSMDRVRNPPPGLVSPRRGTLVNIEAIETPDERTVVFRLGQPQADFPFLVSNPFNAIMPKHVAEPLDQKGTGMKRQIVGSGPFRLERAVDGQIYEFVRFDKYFKGPASLDGIQFFPIRGEIERSVALQGGRIDACFFFANESVLETLRAEDGIVALRRPTPTFINLIPNVTREPFNDVRVREALSLAIDRSAFIRTVGPLAGAFFHSFGLMPPGSAYALSEDEVREISGYDTLPELGGDIEANRERARALLREAGVAEGLQVSIPTRGDVPAFRDSCIDIAAQLKTVGLDVSVDVRDAGAFYAAENAGEFDLVVHSVAISGSLPDQILGEGYTSFGGRNYGRWEDEALDALFREQSQIANRQERIAAIGEFQRSFMRTYNQINLAWVGYGAAHSEAVNGWNPLPDLYEKMQLDNVSLETT